VVFNPSVLDKACDDTFPNRPQSRKLRLFYWSIRGERQQEVWQPPKNAGTETTAKEEAGVQSGK
jgi:hypothetical protein